MKRGEVWWVEFDPAVGSEIKKTRPAVILSNDLANRHLSRVIVVPVSSSVDKLYPGEAQVVVGGRPGKAMADQLMAADKSRLKSSLGVLSKLEIGAVEDAVALHLGMKR